MPQNPLAATVAVQSGVSKPLQLDGDGKLLVAATVNPSGAVTIADGDDVAEGATDDAAWAGTGAATLIALGKAENLAIGSVSDAAWSGTGDATVISLLKKIALNTAPA